MARATIAKKPTSHVATSKAAPESSARPSARARGFVIAASTIVAAGVVTAVASAIITPERLDHLFAPSPSSVRTAGPVTYGDVVDRSHSITLNVPVAWAHTGGKYDVKYDGVQDAGVAMNAGTNPLQGTMYGVDGVYAGVSTAVVARLQMATWSDEKLMAWATKQDNVDDFSIDGCVLTAAQLPARPGWIVASRVWEGCEGKAGFSLYEAVEIPPDRSFVLNMEMNNDTRTSSAVFDHIAATVAIDTSHVPISANGPALLEK